MTDKNNTLTVLDIFETGPDLWWDWLVLAGGVELDNYFSTSAFRKVSNTA